MKTLPKVKQMDDCKNYGECMAWHLHAKRITFRRYGPHGEMRRPMIHRFEVRGGVSYAESAAEFLFLTNPLLRALSRRGK